MRQAVLDHWPRDPGLSGQLWTRRLVGELIAKLYLVRLTEPGVGKYLKRWGLTFQCPDQRAVEQDPQALRRWREEIWPQIRAQAKAEEVRSSSPTRPAPDPTRSPAAPGARRGRRPWCGAAETGSR
ncbi:winged helix-turn-helix domain-containing protein [Streptomyces verrucosisporus]|uniref:winged helix-turn-helix domain-containing protein n=1 Tax=Streptomyces verrucosisporus TaxID=1695161 RepID=UPI0027DA7A23|nr:winged helix-turn-helix domain-containing protein [Streptomyces verrucosisporus]